MFISKRNLLTGLKDVDRLVLDLLDDKQLLEMCRLNKTYYKNVCDETYFRNRTFSKYPETVKYKDSAEITNWKNHLLKVVRYKDLLKTYFKYDYTPEDESPELLYLARKLVPKNYDYNKNIALIQASAKGNLATIKYLVESGADVTTDGNLTLRIASMGGNLPIVKYLVEKGADITAKNNLPLIWASRNGDLSVIKYLVKNGADITAQDNISLRWASENGHLATVKYLAENGADITAFNNEALKYAILNGHLNVVKYLAENGADITALDNEALRWASEKGHLEVVKYLESL